MEFNGKNWKILEEKQGVRPFLGANSYIIPKKNYKKKKVLVLMAYTMNPIIP